MRIRRAERERPAVGAMTAMFAVVAALMVLGWGMLFVVVLPGHYMVGDGTLFGLGVAVTAFVLGVRHAFDADHIAAIDNTTRSLVDRAGRPPVSVGFWFALGHSTVVVVAVGLMAAGVNALASQISDEDSVLVAVTGVWGPLVSGLFLLLIGTVNLVSLVAIWRMFRRLRSGGTTGTSSRSSWTGGACSPGSCGGSPGTSTGPGRCTPSACSSGSGSTPPRRSGSSSSEAAPP